MNNDIIFYAFRYALGRKTYVVSDVCNYLYQNWSQLNEQTQETIIKEIKKYLKSEEDRFSDINITWQRLLNVLNKGD